MGLSKGFVILPRYTAVENHLLCTLLFKYAYLVMHAQNNLPYKAEIMSVYLSPQHADNSACLHQSKQDLLEMKAESTGTSEYIFISLNMPAFIRTSAQKAVV